MKLKPGKVCKLKDVCKYSVNAHGIPCYGALDDRETNFICEIGEGDDGNNKRSEIMDG